MDSKTSSTQRPMIDYSYMERKKSVYDYRITDLGRISPLHPDP